MTLEGSRSPRWQPTEPDRQLTHGREGRTIKGEEPFLKRGVKNHVQWQARGVPRLITDNDESFIEEPEEVVGDPYSHRSSLEPGRRRRIVLGRLQCRRYRTAQRALYWILDTGLRSSVRQRARAISVPALLDTALIENGFRCYRDHCVQCHGAPGVARDDLGKGLLPLPNNFSADRA